jgi:hypothetical protein
MNRKSTNPFETQSLSSLITPCVSLSFLLTIGPAYANRADRLAGINVDRDLVRQMRAENRAERLENRALRLENRATQRSFVTPQAISLPAVQNSINPSISAVRHQVRRVDDRVRRNDDKTWQVLQTGKVRNVNASVELNFGSNERSIQLGQELFAQGAASVTLTVGGGEKTFSSGSKVTAAEYASIIQVLGGEGQSLQIDNQGRASGGDLSLQSLTGGSNIKVSGLVIPEAVKVVGNFSNSSDFNLTGDLINNGSIYALSNREGANKASISVRNLTNNAGGVISSVTNLSMFPQYDNLQSEVDLKLRVNESLVNRGEISSSGNLTLSAQVVSNESKSNSVASISAAKDVLIETAVLNNSGTVSAQQNIGITTGAYESNGSLAINNTGGTIQALNGAITVGDPANTAKANTALVGGDWLSNELNLYSGDGALTVDVGDLTGAVTARAGTANIVADTENLIIKSLHTTGDPTIKNTNNVLIDDDITTDGAPLAILARGDINFDIDATIDTSSLVGAGGSILMVAGSNWSTVGANNSISGGSTGGGSINGAGFLIDIISDGATNAGDITLIAFGGNGGPGDILLESSSLSALGGAGFNNGNITVIGGGSVQLALVDAQGIGANAGTGNILVSSFQPVVVNGPVLINDTTGAVVQGSFAPGSVSSGLDTIVFDSVFAGGSVQVQSARDAQIADVDAQKLIVTSSGSIALFGSIVAPGGVALVAGRDIGADGLAPVDILTLNTSGNGGNVLMVAGAAFTQNGTSITITGGTSTGGFIDFDDSNGAGALGTVDTDSSGGNGSGGSLTMIAYGGTDPFGGQILTDFEDTVILTGGIGTGGNGDVTIIAGLNDAAEVGLGIRGSIDTTGGSAPGTGNAYLATAAPLGGVTIAKSNLAVTAGTFKGGATVVSDAFVDDIDVGDGANITIISGGFLETTAYTGGDNSSLNLSAGTSVRLNQSVGADVGSFSLAAGTFVELYGDIIAPQGILVVAGSDIVVPNNLVTISSASATGDAGNIAFVAGAAFTQAAGTITVTGASGLGGSVNFTLQPNTTIDSSSTAVNGSAGDIVLVGFDGTPGEGNILISNIAVVNASGNGNGANGDIIMVSGSNTIGISGQMDINLTGAAGTGSITMQNSVPVVPVTLSKTTGGIVSGDFRGGTLRTGNIAAGNLTVEGGLIDLASGGNVLALNLVASAGAVGNGGTVRVVSGSNEVFEVGGSTGLNGVGSVLASGGTTSGNAGTIDIEARGTGGLNAIQAGPLDATEGDGGHIRLVALNGNLVLGGLVNLSVDAGTATAASHNGGSVELYGANFAGSGALITASATGAGTAGSVDITATAGGNIQLGTNPGDINLAGQFSSVELETLGGGNINVTATGGFTATSLISLTASGNVTVDGSISSPTTNISGLAVTNNAGITGSTLLDIDTNAYTNNSSTNGGVIDLHSLPGQSLTLAGNGSFTSTTETKIESDVNMLLTGNQNFAGNVDFTATTSPTANITLIGTANYVGVNQVRVTTYTFNQLGNISGNPLIINTTFFNIVNNNGNVVLPADLIYTGQNLAIIASGNIIGSGLATINLSSGAGDAGSLSLLAGFNSSPSTGSQTNTAGPTTIAGLSTSGGDIQLNGVTINLSSTSGNGGSLTAVANGGSTNSGTIDLGTVTTTGTTSQSGAVQIIGEGGVTVGAINTNGTATTDGGVSIAVAEPTVTGTLTYANGTRTSGSLTFAGTTQGNISTASITAGGAGVFLSGASSALNTMQNTGQIQADSLGVVSGLGVTSLAGTVNTLAVSGAGEVSYSQGVQDLNISLVMGSTLDLIVSSAGRVILSPTSVVSVRDLNLTGAAGVGVDAIVLAGPITAGNDITLTAQGGGNLTVDQSLNASSALVLSSASGNLAVTNGVNLTAPTVFLGASLALTVAGNVNAPTSVTLVSGDDILMSDITGTIQPTQNLELTTSFGSIGTLATPFSFSSDTVSLTAGAGSVYFSNPSANPVELRFGSSRNEFSFSAGGPITITGNIATSGGTDGDILITQNGPGRLTVGEGVSITSQEGDIVINNTDIDKKTGFLIFEDDVTIKGSGTTAGVGEVYLVLGGIPAEPVQKKAPKKNVTVIEQNGGLVYIGKKGLTVKKQTNIVLSALGRNLVFSTGGKQNKKNIQLGSNIAITADPPGDVYIPVERGRGGRATLSTTSGSVGTLMASAVPSRASVEMIANLGDQAGLLGNLSGTFTDASSAGTLNAEGELGLLVSPSLPLADANTSSVLMTETLNATASPIYTTLAGGINQTSFADKTDNEISNVVPLFSDYLPGGNAVSEQHSIKSGSALIAASKDLNVSTPDAKISIARDSVVLVVVGAHGTSVYDLHDSKREGVQVGFGSQSVSLTPGRHTTVCSRRSGSYSEINPVESILHRDVNELATANGVGAFTSEFAIHSAVQTVGSLQSIFASSHPQCSKLSSRMMKTSAILLHLSGSQEPFQQYLHPRMAAYR